MSAEKPEIIRPRGNEVMLPHHGLREVYSPYLQKRMMETGGPTGPIGLQYRAQPEKERQYFRGEASDPLREDEKEVAPGLVYKYRAKINESGQVEYPGRALWTITRECASYCRFCTRGREVGLPWNEIGLGRGALSRVKELSEEQIKETLRFITSEPGLNETILSGGDPLKVNSEKLGYITRCLRKLQEKGKLKIVRIGTRMPMQDPGAVKEGHFRAVAQLKNPNVMVHINHPAELTDEALEVLYRFREGNGQRFSGANVYSQSVLLRDVNDNVETLAELFNKLAEHGIRPYYVYQNDPVYWAKHYTVPIDKAIAIFDQLRPRLSGLAATARFVIDTPEGYGKIPIPEGGAWKVDFGAGFEDFKGNRFPLE